MTKKKSLLNPMPHTNVRKYKKNISSSSYIQANIFKMGFALIGDDPVIAMTNKQNWRSPSTI